MNEYWQIGSSLDWDMNPDKPVKHIWIDVFENGKKKIRVYFYPTDSEYGTLLKYWNEHGQEELMDVDLSLEDLPVSVGGYKAAVKPNKDVLQEKVTIFVRQELKKCKN